MPKRSNDFQKLITFIEKEFSPESIEVVESALLRESISDVEREVDILIQGEINGYQISIGVECRDRKRKADLTWIDEIIGKYQHLPIDRKVAISKCGFTKTALDKAVKYNIETLTLEEAFETDWIETVVRIASWQMEGRKLVYNSLGFKFCEDTKSPPKDVSELDVLYDKEGGAIGKIQGLKEWIIETPPLIESAIKKEVDKMRPLFTEGLNVSQINLNIPADLTYKSSNGVDYNVVAIIVNVECRVEIIKPVISEYKLKDKYVAMTKAIFNDAPVEVTAAAINMGTENSEFKMFFSSNQEIVHELNTNESEDT